MFQFAPPPNVARSQQAFRIWLRPVPPPMAHFAIRIAKYELDKLVREGISAADFEATKSFLTKQTGLTKSALVKQALQHLSNTQAKSAGGGLFELGKARFGRYGDAARQSAQIAVYRTAKRKAFRNVFDTA